MSDKDGYGQKLRESRKAKGLTLIAASLKIEIDYSTLSKYENEKIEPTIRTLKKLCEIYNISADYILQLSNDKKIKR